MNKTIIIKAARLFALMTIVLTSSCSDYLDDIPKGQKTPATWEDYNAFIKNEMFHYNEIDQTSILMGDLFQTPTKLNSNELSKAHYYWDENTDRTLINIDDRFAYNRAYEAIFYWNLIVESAPSVTECSQQQRDMLEAQARVLRAMTYFYVTNYYADQYCDQTKNNLAVPLVYGSSVESSSPQVSLQTIYEFMIDDLKKAINALPDNGETYYHPTKASGLGMLARVYLSMGDYENALTYANQALAGNDKLYDWTSFYMNDKERYDAPTNYSYVVSTQPDPEKTNPENYVFRYGSMTNYMGDYSSAYAIGEERAELFEQGDTRLLCHWKRRVSSSFGVYYYGIYGIVQNKGGMRSPEMYYIKAECLARKGGQANIDEAMALVNKVRKTRVLPDFYTDWSATSTQEAVKKIIADKSNEYIRSMVSFCDARRLNKDSEYATTKTRTLNGTTYSLSPSSHLWIMPFPSTVMSNPGNGSITQNVNK